MDARDMIVVHIAFRREYRLAPGLVRSVIPGDDVRAREISDYTRRFPGTATP